MNINQSWECVEGKKHGFLICVAVLAALCCMLLTPNPVAAQGLCSNPQGAGKGGFTVSSNTVCIGNVLSVTTNPGIQNATYVYIYNSSMNIDSLGLKGVPDRGFQYAIPGSYTILQFGSNGATGTIACQVVSIVPTAQINYTYRICSSGTGNSKSVKLDIALDAVTKNYDNILVNWGDGTPDQSYPISAVGTITHVYATAADYIVSVRGAFNVNLGCITQINRQSISVRLGSTTQPFVQTLTSTPNGATMQVQANASDVIEIWQKNGTTYQPTGITAVNGAMVSLSANTQQTQCYQLVVRDACDNLVKSDEVCTINLNAVAGNKQNNLTWPAYQGTGTFLGYRIKRTANGNTTTLTPANFLNKATSSHTDASNIQCGVQYCYTMEVMAGPTLITSSQTCVTGLSQETVGAIPNMLVSVEDDGQIRIRALTPTTGATTNFSLIISRADTPAGPFQQIGFSSNNTIFFDKSANPNNQSYCYQVVYRNECGNESPPSKSCTIWLTSKGTGIDWTADSPFAPGTVTRYVLEIYDTATNTLYKEIPLGGNTHYEPDPNDQSTQTFRYRIRAESTTGESTSNYYELKRNAGIFVPTAFTPNGDGQNDTFVAVGTFWEAFSMTIYTRWGEAVYTTNNKAEGWDGTLHGQPLPAGTYTYRIDILDKDKQQIVKRGAVMLIR